MIQSMTAFARVASEGDFGNAIWEIRSVNHRYFDLFIRLPENLTWLEPLARERLREHLSRGKIECILRYQAPPTTRSTIALDHRALDHLLKACTEINHHAKGNCSPPNALKILNSPGIIKNEAPDDDKIQTELLSLLDKAIIELRDARQREGQALCALFIERLQTMSTIAKFIRERAPIILLQQREKLFARLADINVQFDSTRLEQELVLYAQKTDIAEELDRLLTHIEEVKRLLKQGGTQGRRLDFLMQELNRESNTLGSKSSDADIISQVVELKVLIEQLREQIQNIE